MTGIDPTTVRLSSHFLLSDFIGCDSVYRKGYANPFTEADHPKLKEGKLLASSLDYMLELYGPLSLTYGFISPRLSRKIVKYQDPNKPSYHRWDLGAATDICFHGWRDGPPIRLVGEFCSNTGLSFSRIITYSESDIICFAVSTKEKQMLNKVYENRYVPGQRKPKFIRYPTNNDPKRSLLLSDAIREVEGVVDEWRGQGWPSYHGGGIKQYEHIRLGSFTLLSDFLYSPIKAHKGIPNNVGEPEAWGERLKLNISRAAETNDAVQETLYSTNDSRASIVFAIDCNQRPWTERFIIDYVPSSTFMVRGEDPLACFQTAIDSILNPCVDDIRRIRMKKGEDRIRVIGSRV